MTDVIDFSAKRQERIEKHKELEMTEKCRNLNALISEMRLVANKHINVFGATTWQLCGAALFILSRGFVESDPKMERHELREYIHDLLDKQIDDAYEDLWESKGEAP